MCFYYAAHERLGFDADYVCYGHYWPSACDWIVPGTYIED